MIVTLFAGIIIVNIPTRLVSGKTVTNVVNGFRTSKIMLDREHHIAILPRIDGIMLLRSHQPIVQDVGRWLSLIAKIIPEFPMQVKVYIATHAEKLLPPQEGHQEEDLSQG
jgi:hypothetical protein